MRQRRYGHKVCLNEVPEPHSHYHPRVRQTSRTKMYVEMDFYCGRTRRVIVLFNLNTDSSMVHQYTYLQVLDQVFKEAFSQTQNVGSESCWMEPVRVIAILAQLTRGASGGLLELHQAASADLHSTLAPKTSHRTRRPQRCRRCKTSPPGLPEQSSDWSCRAFAAVRLPLW